MPTAPFSAAGSPVIKGTPSKAVPGAIKFTKGAALAKATAHVDDLIGLNVKTAGAGQDAALGALMGVLFGRMVSIIPGLNHLVAEGVPRDALIGALAASATSHLARTDPATSNILAPVADAPMSKLV